MIHRAEAIGVVTGTPEEVYALLADYEAYPAWLSEVSSSRLLAREGDVAIVELKVPGHVRQPLVLEMIQTRGRSLMFTQVDRYRTQGLAGRLDLASGPAGRVSLYGELAIGASALRLGCRRRLRRVLEGILGALAERLHPADVRSGDSPEQQTLLEVRRTAEGIEVWVGRQRFHLPEGRCR